LNRRFFYLVGDDLEVAPVADIAMPMIARDLFPDAATRAKMSTQSESDPSDGMQSKSMA
jgi:hypothetical protein